MDRHLKLVENDDADDAPHDYDFPDGCHVVAPGARLSDEKAEELHQAVHKIMARRT